MGPLAVNGVLRLANLLPQQVIGPRAGQQGCGGGAEALAVGDGEHVVHIAGVGGRRDGGLGVVEGESGGLEELVMQGALDGGHHALGHLLQQVCVGRLGQGEGDAASEALEVEVVLAEVVLEGLEGQGAVLDALQEGVGEDLAPDGLGLGA